MSGAAEGSTSVDQLGVRVTEMAALLTKRAPNLCPNVAPRQYKMVASNILSICGTPKQRADAEAFLALKAAEITRNNERDNEKEDEADNRMEGEGRGERHVVLKTDIDIGTRTFRIASAKIAEKTEAALHNLALLMELHLNAGPEELEPYIKQFASANKLGPDLPAATTLQEVCSLAYGLQIATSNMPGWVGYVGSFRMPLADDLDMTSVMQELFENAPPPQPTSAPTSAAKNKASGGRASRSKSKSKGSGVQKPGGTEGRGAGSTKERPSEGKTSSKGSKRKK